MRNFAADGVLDLRKHTFARRSLAHLHGYWRFTWHKFLPPVDLNGEFVPPSAGQSLPAASLPDAQELYLHVPGSWDSPRNFAPRPQPKPADRSHAYGTYRLTVLLAPDAPERLYIYCPEQRDAYRIYVNRADGLPGQPLCSSGEAADTLAATRPLLHSSVRDFTRAGDVLYFTMHVALRASAIGGARNPPLIGLQEAVQSRREGGIIYHLTLAGALFMIALYHFVLYGLRRRELAQLYLAILAALFGVRVCLLG